MRTRVMKREQSDAQLIALGERFMEIQKRLSPVRAEHSRLFDECRDYARGRTGWEPDPANPPGLYEQYALAFKEMSDRNGYVPCDRRLESLHREQDQIMREIMRMPAKSIAGLRAKTLVAIEPNGRLWDGAPRDLDWDEQAVRSLIEAACAVAGVPIPTEKSETPDEEAIAPHCGSAALN